MLPFHSKYYNKVCSVPHKKALQVFLLSATHSRLKQICIIKKHVEPTLHVEYKLHYLLHY